MVETCEVKGESFGVRVLKVLAWRHLPPSSLPVSARRIFTGVSPSNMVITSLIWRNSRLSMLGTRR